MKKTWFVLVLMLFSQSKINFATGINIESSSLTHFKNDFYNEINLKNSTKYDFGENIIEKTNDYFILFDKNLNEINRFNSIIPISFNNSIGYLVKKNDNYTLINTNGSAIIDNNILNSMDFNYLSSSFLVKDNIILIKDDINSLNFEIINNNTHRKLTIPFINNVSNNFITPMGVVYNLNYFNTLTNNNFDKVEFRFDPKTVFSDKTITTMIFYKDNIQKGFGTIDSNGSISNILIGDGSYIFDKSMENYLIVKDTINNNIYLFNNNANRLLKNFNLKEYKFINDILVLRTRDEFIFLDRNGYIIGNYKTNTDVYLDFYIQNNNTLFVISDNNKAISSLLFDENQKLISSTSSIKDNLSKIDLIKPNRIKPLDIYFNDRKVKFFNSKGVLYNGNSYIPLRELAFLTNSSLNWDNNTKEVLLSTVDDKILRIKTNKLSLYSGDLLVKTFTTPVLNFDNSNLVKVSDFKDILNLNIEFKNNILYIENKAD